MVHIPPLPEYADDLLRLARRAAHGVPVDTAAPRRWHRRRVLLSTHLTNDVATLEAVHRRPDIAVLDPKQHLVLG